MAIFYSRFMFIAWMECRDSYSNCIFSKINDIVNGFTLSCHDIVNFKLLDTLPPPHKMPSPPPSWGMDRILLVHDIVRKFTLSCHDIVNFKILDTPPPRKRRRRRRRGVWIEYYWFMTSWINLRCRATTSLPSKFWIPPPIKCRRLCNRRVWIE